MLETLNKSRWRNWRAKSACTERAATRNETRYVLAENAGAGSYMIALGHPVSGKFHADHFESACRQLLLRHEALRTHFKMNGRRVDAVVSEHPVINLRTTRWIDASLASFRDWAVPLIFDSVDPSTPGSLLRFLVADYGDSWRFTIAGHHAITDGISRGVMNRELLKLYSGQDLPPLATVRPPDSVHAPDQDLEVTRLVEALPNSVRLFPDVTENGQSKASGVFVEQSFGGLSKTVKRLSRICEATRFNVLSAAYALSLKGAAGTSELATFFQSEGRKRHGISNAIVGPCSNTLPLNLRFDPDASFVSFVQDLGHRTHAVLALENAPILERTISHEKQPTVSINYFPPAPRIAIDGMTVGPREFLDRRTEYDLNMVWSEEGGRLNGRLFYNPNRISERRAQHILQLQAAIIEAAMEQSHASGRELLAQVRGRFDTAIESPMPETSPMRALHDAFFEHAAAAPADLAIVFEQERMTYGALAQRAKAYARSLIAAGVTREMPVPILAERGPALIAAMLGVSAAGGSFAVIDSAYPVARIRLMMDMLEAKIAIRADNGRSSFSDDELVWIVPDAGPDLSTVAEVAPRDVAYHLFTSGTTGQPKRVSHSDRTLQRFTRWQVSEAGLERPVTVLLAGLSHDPVLRDVFLPLSHGGSVAIPGTDALTDPDALRRMISTAGVSVLHLTPAMGTMIGIGAREWATPGVQAIFWGGARLNPDLVLDWHVRAQDAQQFNLYGATETPQAALIHRIHPGEVCDSIPLGRDLPWTNARLLDTAGDPVGPFDVAEIVIEMADPVVGTVNHLGHQSPVPSRVHHTGDLGFTSPEGDVHFLGRRDAQLNLNGHRIDPVEIEASAESLSGIEQACVLVSQEEPSGLYLFAADNGSGVASEQVLHSLRQRLPAYMVPKHVSVVEFLPLTANGKVDRKALQLAVNDLKQRRTNAPPVNADERFLADLLSKYTGQSSPSRDDSLVDLGADSLSLLEARFALEEHGYDLPQNWEFLPISALIQLRAAEPPISSERWSLFKLHRLDTFIVLRCLAILLIVMHHAGLPIMTGASVMLFAFAGFALGKIQMPAILNDGKTGRIWSMVVKLSIPLAVVSIFLYGQNSLRGIPPHLAMILPIENLASFIDEVVLQRDSSARREVWLWFLHVYLQMFVIIGALLAIPSLFRWLREDHWRSALSFFLASNAIMAGTFALAVGYGPEAQGTRTYWEQFPTTIMPFLAIGCVFALADNWPKIRLAFSLAVLQFCMFSFVYQVHTEPLWIGSLVLAVLIPEVRLPRVMSVILASVSTQALMIYLTHWTTLLILKRFAQPFLPSAVQIVIALAIGVMVGRAFRPVLNALGVNRLAETKITFSPRLRPERI